MQYPGKRCYIEVEVYTNFRVTQEFDILECFKARLWKEFYKI